MLQLLSLKEHDEGQTNTVRGRTPLDPDEVSVMAYYDWWLMIDLSFTHHDYIDCCWIFTAHQCNSWMYRSSIGKALARKSVVQRKSHASGLIRRYDRRGGKFSLPWVWITLFQKRTSVCSLPKAQKIIWEILLDHPFDEFSQRVPLLLSILLVAIENL